MEEPGQARAGIRSPHHAPLPNRTSEFSALVGENGYLGSAGLTA